jgi:hypothetical protein
VGSGIIVILNMWVAIGLKLVGCLDSTATRQQRCAVADYSLSTYTAPLNETSLIFQKLHSPSYTPGTLPLYFSHNLTITPATLSPSTLPIIFNLAPFILLTIILLAAGLPMLGCCFWPEQWPGKYCACGRGERDSGGGGGGGGGGRWGVVVVGGVGLVLGVGCFAGVLGVKDGFVGGLADGQCKVAKFVESF